MCVLRVSANRKTLSDFLSETRFPYCYEHDKTTLRRFGRDKGKPFRYAGFQTWVSNKEWNDMPGQVSDAIRFLRRHRDHLKRLRSEFKAQDIILDFPYYLRIGKDDVVIQGDFLPPALISLAGELGIGIEMTLYPSQRSSKRQEKIAEPAAPPNRRPARPGATRTPRRSGSR
jgi:hypothetical protein